LGVERHRDAPLPASLGRRHPCSPSSSVVTCTSSRVTDQATAGAPEAARPPLLIATEPAVSSFFSPLCFLTVAVISIGKVITTAPLVTNSSCHQVWLTTVQCSSPLAPSIVAISDCASSSSSRPSRGHRARLPMAGHLRCHSTSTDHPIVIMICSCCYCSPPLHLYRVEAA
jgi:hypothetical protein